MLKILKEEIIEVSKRDFKGWLKSLMKRMYREGFLGKNMNYIPRTTTIMQEQRICSHGYSFVGGLK